MIGREIQEFDKVYQQEHERPAMINLDDLPENISEGIIEYMETNNIPKLDNYLRMDTAINFYLEWKGIIGYSSYIIAIIEKAFYAKINFKTEENVL